MDTYELGFGVPKLGRFIAMYGTMVRRATGSKVHFRIDQLVVESKSPSLGFNPVDGPVLGDGWRLHNWCVMRTYEESVT